MLATSYSRADVSASVFGQGHTRLSLGAGYGSFRDNDYFILGLGAGYYVMDGLEAGLAGEAWMGSKPHIYTVSPQLTYIFFQGEQWKPYIGGFYKRTFYDTLDNLNSGGGRAGIVTPMGQHTYLSAGVVYEKYFNCDKAIYSDCSLVYPELGISFSY